MPSQSRESLRALERTGFPTYHERAAARNALWPLELRDREVIKATLREHPEGNAPAHGSAAPADARVPLRRILIAEDNEQLRQDLAELLAREHGITVDTTGDGKEALELLTRSDHSYS